MKYDCTKTLDYLHEHRRMCRTYYDSHEGYCDGECPLAGMMDCNEATQDVIDMVQKWSDEHPEAPKLTERDYSFLDCFGPADKYIKRQYGILSVIWYDPMITTGAMEIPIDATMFKCVEKGQKWSFDDLLKLEVEE